MLDSNEIKIGVLKELMDKMRELQGGKMRPRAVEVSVAAEKPEGALDRSPGEHDIADGPDLEKKDLLSAAGPDQEPDGDELSPEDAKLLEEILGAGGHEDAS